MYKYIIQNKVRTTSYLYQSIELNGFELRHPDDDYNAADNPGYIIAEKIVNGKNIADVVSKFRNDLLETISFLSTVSQCAFSIVGASFVVKKLDKNRDHVFFYYYAEDTETVKLPINNKEIQNYQKLFQNPELRLPARLIKESSTASNLFSRVSLLIIALEAFAEQETIYGRCKNCRNKYSYPGTNKNTIKKIVGRSTYKLLYGKGGFRHKLSHGESVGERTAEQLSGEIFSKLLIYLNNEYGTDIEEAKNSPRTFYSFKNGKFYFRPTTDKRNFKLEDLGDSFPPDDTKFTMEHRRPSNY